VEKENYCFDLAKVKKGYDLIAKEYAEHYFHELDEKPFDRRILEWFAAQVPSGEEVYDVGCGPGEITSFLHHLGVDVKGIDISPNMINVARTLTPGCLFMVDNMLNLNMPDESVFGITAFYAIVHFSLKEVNRTLEEFYRVLKPGGNLLFSFHVGDEIISTENFLEKEGAALDFVFFDVDEIRDMAESAGFCFEECMVRYPYVEREYASRRAYIWAKKSNNSEQNKNIYARSK